MSRVKILGIVLVVVAFLLAAAWLKLRGSDIPYAVLDAKYGNASSRFVDLPGGFHVHYQDDGAPGLPLLLLLHGYGDSFTSWEGWVSRLKDRFHVISVDFPGHGLTRAPEGYALSGDGLVDFVEAFASALALPPFALAGNSMGGGTAWAFAARHPERVDALILVDAAGFPSEKPPAKTPLAFRILKYRLGRAFLSHIDNRPLIDSGLKVDVYDASLITPALVDRWAEFQRAPGHRAILMSLDPRSFTTATTERLRSIRARTLVLHGENDLLIEPASAREFAAAIPDARLILYPQVGHLPQIEIPARSAADVAGFLSAR